MCCNGWINSLRRAVAKAIALLLLGAVCSLGAHAAPKAERWPYFEPHDPDNPAQVDHRIWDFFLRRYLRQPDDGIARLAYAEVDTENRLKLSVYLSNLQRTPIRGYSRAEQRAFWINFYNAATVKLILDRYPVRSIRDIDITPGLFAKGPWGARRLKADGQTVSLDDIEHRILRPIWKDPRIHYAVNCASLGCPNLAPRAFTAENTEELLEAGARDYVNHPRGARLENGKLIVSSIYEWFKADFGGNDAGVIDHLIRYAHPPLKAQLADIRKISDDEYDWSLNDVAPARRP